MTPAGIYLRVSTDEQNTEVQLPALERMAAARGYDVVEVYRDAAIGGTKSKMERPELARVFQDAARGRIRAVFVWALDRFSRDDSFTGGVLMIGELDHYRCALISHEETAIDSSGPFREPLVVLSLKWAASERARLIRRTNEGIAYARAHGTKSGKAIGRPRVELSDAMLDRALELRHRTDISPSRRLSTPRSWRYVATLLQGEGFTVPTKRGVGKVKHQTLQRLAMARAAETVCCAWPGCDLPREAFQHREGSEYPDAHPFTPRHWPKPPATWCGAQATKPGGSHEQARG